MSPGPIHTAESLQPSSIPKTLMHISVSCTLLPTARAMRGVDEVDKDNKMAEKQVPKM